MQCQWPIINGKDILTKRFRRDCRYTCRKCGLLKNLVLAFVLAMYGVGSTQIRI